MIKRFFNFILNPKKKFLQVNFIKKKYKKYTKLNAEKFFKEKKILHFFSEGNSSEYKPNFFDLKHLYDNVIKRKPRCILEFGVGFSTISMALALQENEKKGFQGKIYVVDPEKKWIQNTKKKIDLNLQKFISFNYSSVHVENFNGQLVSFFKKLPNIIPEFILLDGPNSSSVVGSYKGLSFDETRSIVAADILLYESSSPNKFFILVDGRHRNAKFLRNNLRDSYTFKENQVLKYFSFEKL